MSEPANTPPDRRGRLVLLFSAALLALAIAAAVLVLSVGPPQTKSEPEGSAPGPTVPAAQQSVDDGPSEPADPANAAEDDPPASEPPRPGALEPAAGDPYALLTWPIWGAQDIRPMIRATLDTRGQNLQGERDVRLKGHYPFRTRLRPGYALRMLIPQRELERIRFEFSSDNWFGRISHQKVGGIGQLVAMAGSPDAPTEFVDGCGGRSQTNGGPVLLDIRHEGGFVVVSRGPETLVRLRSAESPQMLAIAGEFALGHLSWLRVDPLTASDSLPRGWSADGPREPALMRLISQETAGEPLAVDGLDQAAPNAPAQTAWLGHAGPGLYELTLRELTGQLRVMVGAYGGGSYRSAVLIPQEGGVVLCADAKNGEEVRRQREAGWWFTLPLRLDALIGEDSAVVYAAGATGGRVQVLAEAASGRSGMSAIGVGFRLEGGQGPSRAVWTVQRAGGFDAPLRLLEGFADLPRAIPPDAATDPAPAGSGGLDARLEAIATTAFSRPYSRLPAAHKARVLEHASRVGKTGAERAEASLRLIELAILHGRNAEAVIEALEQWPLRWAMGGSDNRGWDRLTAAYDALASRLAVEAVEAADSDGLERLLGAWYRAHSPASAGTGPTPGEAAPPLLSLLALQQALESQTPAQAMLLAMRIRFQSNIANPRRTISLPDVAAFLAEPLGPRLPGGSPIQVEPSALQAWAHPFEHRPLRTASRLAADLNAAVTMGMWEHGARLITQPLIEDVLVADPMDADLFTGLHTLIRNKIQAHPALARTIQQDHGALAELRLERMLREGEWSGLGSLAMQFAGTQAARRAKLLLADRDLAAGQFAPALRRYEQLLGEETEVNLTSDVAARRRLAAALMGADLPPTLPGSVRIGQVQLASGELERVVAGLLAARRETGTSQLAQAGPGELAAPQVRLYSFVVAGLKDVNRQAGTLDSDAFRATQIGPRVYLSMRNVLACIDPAARRLSWERRSEQRVHLPGPAAPVLHAGQLLARIPKPRDAGFDLASFDLNRGERRVLIPSADAAVSDPFTVDGQLWMLVRRNTADAGLLVLQRMLPDARSVVEQTELLRMAVWPSLLRTSTPLLLADCVVVQVGDVLLCLERSGELRWIRRLPHMPASLIGSLPLPAELSLASDGQTLLALGHSWPVLLAADLRTGRLLWRKNWLGRGQVLACRDDVAVAAVGGRLYALGARDGAVLGSQGGPSADALFVADARHPRILALGAGLSQIFTFQSQSPGLQAEGGLLPVGGELPGKVVWLQWVGGRGVAVSRTDDRNVHLLLLEPRPGDKVD